MFVKDELGGEASTYLSVIAAIAGGATRQGEIAGRSGLAPSAAAFYLDRLHRLHVLEHRRPAGAPARARGLWRVSDGYVRFWFRFVRPDLTDLEAYRHEVVYRDRVRGQLDHFVSAPAFEDACRDHAREQLGRDPEYPEAAAVGSWWGSVPIDGVAGSRRTRQAEIDIAGYDGNRLVLAGEAKWQSRPVDTDALGQLIGTARYVPGFGPYTRLALYARAGFTPHLRSRATQEGVILRTVEDLYR